MTRFPRGSEWRKWDLHVHAPGTKLNNRYGTPPDIERFCILLEESDVSAFAITDYFSLDTFFRVRKAFEGQFPDSDKLLLPNIELRLNESVNGANHIVDFHLILRPDITPEVGNRLLANLCTEITDAAGRKLPCSELNSLAHFESAVVSRESLKSAIDSTFGPKAHRTDHILTIVPANNNGIRAESGSRRKAVIADEIDKIADAIFGNPGNSDYFLKPDRYEDATQHAPAKPVFAGSDAHGFEQLDAWLGKTVDDVENRKHTTWIKSDLTYEGLLQTLAEPSERVKLQPLKPDGKEPYHLISAVRFEDGGTFPPEIKLNQNLVSVIGSRSSGKSALIAHIAHAVDPTYAIEQQIASGNVRREEEAGPAAGVTWRDAESAQCTVEWGGNVAARGRVIYIPQNSLSAISNRPGEITSKIEPALVRRHPEVESLLNNMKNSIAAENSSIRAAVDRWFVLTARLSALQSTLRDLGDHAAIELRLGKLVEEARAQQQRAGDIESAARYDSIQKTLGNLAAQLSIVDLEFKTLAGLHGNSFAPRRDFVSVNVQMIPELSSLPTRARRAVERVLESKSQEMISALAHTLTHEYAALSEQRCVLVAEMESIEQSNADLIDSQASNIELHRLNFEVQTQQKALAAIHGVESEIAQIEARRAEAIATIATGVTTRVATFKNFASDFTRITPQLDDLTVGVEVGFDEQVLDSISDTFNLRDRSEFIDRDSRFQVTKARADALNFLTALESGKQKLKQGRDARTVATDVLCLTEDVRFHADLDGDRIGGFARSSMTPGKQALFALTLILHESAEPWPLLIDQPEDDLDSRSVYDQIVPYLLNAKRSRQIIMVTHNANLVVGADSEQVLVASRHGGESRNKHERLFDYLSGALEDTRAMRPARNVLDCCGVREHACILLDGGSEAFAKRKAKYHI